MYLICLFNITEEIIVIVILTKCFASIDHLNVVKFYVTVVSFMHAVCTNFFRRTRVLRVHCILLQYCFQLQF
jgi:hypothetical protein